MIQIRQAVLAASMIAVASSFSLSVAGTAPASINPILSANRGVGFGYFGQQSNYAETIPGAAADVQNGWTNGLFINGSDNFHLFGIHHWYSALSFHYANGNVRYRMGKYGESAGQTTKTVEAKFGKTFFLNPRMAATPYIFGGYHWWNRSVTHSVADPENYTNGFVGVGGMFQYAPIQHLVLSADAGIGEVVGAGVHGYHLLGTNTNVAFSLSGRPYYTVGARANYFFLKHWSLYGGLNYTYYGYGASRPVNLTAGAYQITGLQEPSSQTSQFSVDTGLRYTWD